MLLALCSLGQESYGAGAMAVFDVQSFATMKDIFKASRESLNQLQAASSDLQSMNGILGGKLPEGFLARFAAFDQGSYAFTGLLDAFVNPEGDMLRGVNDFAVRQGAKSDFSNYLAAKSYFKDKYFPDKESTSPREIETIQYHKMEATRTATLDSLALSAQQKNTLGQDHKTLQNLVQHGEQNDSVQYQNTIQTKLLEQIAYRLDKIILLQSQQLELLATYVVQAQPAVYRRVGGVQGAKK